MKTVTSRAFNQDVSQAKRLARIEPVFVTDRGRPTHVLLSIDAFRQLTGSGETLIDLLAMEEPVRAEPDWRAAAEMSRRSR
jgi:PHD/YefM family antitoxin component YafN of YafNO toxin-antitoxin module